MSCARPGTIQRYADGPLPIQAALSDVGTASLQAALRALQRLPLELSEQMTHLQVDIGAGGQYGADRRVLVRDDGLPFAEAVPVWQDVGNFCRCSVETMYMHLYASMRAGFCGKVAAQHRDVLMPRRQRAASM